MAAKRKKIASNGTKVPISMTLDREVVKRLDRMAKATNESRSAVARRILADGVGNQEVFVKALSDPILREFMSHLFADRGMLEHMARSVGQEVTDEQLSLYAEKLNEVLK